MKHFRLIIANALLSMMVCATCITTAVSASTISGALYAGDILVSNSSFASANNAVPFTLSTQSLIDSYLIDSDCNNTAITDGEGNDIAYMPAQGAGDDWILYVDDIQQNANNAYKLYTGGDDMNGKIRWFPDNSGMTVADAASLELGNNFEIEIKGLFDTSSGSDKYVLDKTLAIPSYVSNTDEITSQIFGAPAVNQSYSTSNSSVSIYSANWFAQTFTPNVNGYLTSVMMYLAKVGAPTGNFNLALYATTGGVPSGSPLYTISSATASAIPSGFGDNNFSLASPYWLTSGTVYALVGSCPSGDASNYIRWYYNNSNGYAGGQYCNSANSGSSWGSAAYDFRFSVTMSTVAVTSIATGLTAGEHTLKITADGTNLKTYWDGVEKDSDALSGASVNNNSNAWYFCQNGAMLYVEYIKITVSGTLKGYWYWENAATFTDHSGNSNTGTPSFKTTATDPDVTATLTSLEPISLAELAGYSTPTLTGLVPTTAIEPTVTVDQSAAWAKVPGGDVILSILDVAEIPPALFFMPVMLVLIVLASFITYHYTRDMLFTGLIANAIIGAFISLSALYAIPLIIGIISMVVVLTKRKTVSL